MANRITKSELIDDISHSIQEQGKRKQICRNDVAYIVDEFLERISEGLANGFDIFIWGFGTFAPAKRARKKMLNVNTKEMETRPDKILPVFKAGDALKRRVSKEQD